MNWLENPATEILFAEKELDSGKENYIDFLYENGILKFGEFKLKSGRRSPIFLNYGDINSGSTIETLGKFYAIGIIDVFGQNKITTLLGPSYKGVPIVVSAAAEYSKMNETDMHFTFDRKEEKAYGEATGVSREDAAKKIFVGYIPKDSDGILLVDDVITTGATKLDEVEKLRSVVKPHIVGLIIGASREELDENGEDPVSRLSFELSATVYPLMEVVSEAVPYLVSKGKIEKNVRNKMKAYVRTYGTEYVKSWCRKLKFIERNNGVIPACDVPLDKFEEIVSATHDIDGIVAYKIGFEALLGGLDKWVLIARKYTNKPIIYDHQKAGTDIPDTGKRFAEIMKGAGVDAAIIFPQSGPKTEWEWVHSLFEQGLEVIVGGHMTHPSYALSEGGFIADEKIKEMYVLAARAGVNNFVMPGNKPELIEFYKSTIQKVVPPVGELIPAIYSPGLVAQGGKISDAVKVAGDRWYGIVGRGIYEAKDVRKAALEHVSQLKN